MRTALATLLLGGAALIGACSASSPRPDVRTQPAEPEVFFCRYKKNPYTLPSGSLALSTDGRAFAQVAHGRGAGLTLTVPWGAPDQRLRADFTTGWISYRTYLGLEKPLTVYPLRPVKIGVLELNSWAAFEYQGTTADKRMLVETRPSMPFRPAAPLRTSLKCEETSIVSGNEEGQLPEDAPDAGVAAKVELVPAVDIPVSSIPGGPAEGFLRLDKDETWTHTAKVLEEKADSVRIRYGLWAGRIIGWVPRRAIAPPAQDGGGLSSIFGSGGLGGLRGEGAGKPAWKRCGVAVPLFLARDGKLEPVGEIHPNAAVELAKETPQWTEVELPENAWIKLESGQSWALAPGDLEKCRSKPAPAR